MKILFFILLILTTLNLSYQAKLKIQTSSQTKCIPYNERCEFNGEKCCNGLRCRKRNPRSTQWIYHCLYPID